MAASDTLPPIPEVILRMRTIPATERTRYLQTLIGPKTDNALVLHQRVLLITALSEAELWPMGCPGAGRMVEA